MLGSSASILSGCPVVRRSISTRASGAHSQRKATVCLVEQLLLPSDRHLGCDDYLRRTGGFMEHPYLISSVQFSHSVVSDSLRTWITARQASLSITNSRSSLRLMSIKLVMLSSHLVLCHPLFLLPPIPPSIRVFSNESTLCQSTRVSALAAFLPKNTQGWSPVEWTGWIFLQSRGLSRVFSNTIAQKHQFCGAQLSS